MSKCVCNKSIDNNENACHYKCSQCETIIKCEYAKQLCNYFDVCNDCLNDYIIDNPNEIAKILSSVIYNGMLNNVQIDHGLFYFEGNGLMEEIRDFFNANS